MEHKEFEGILWMVASCIGAAVMMTLVRYISDGLPVAQVVFFRNVFALLWFMPWVVYRGPAVLKTRRPKLFLLRGVIGLTAMHGWFYSLTVMPLAEATALSFTAPLFSTILALIFFKEKIGIHRVTALAIGFTGAMIILRPGSEAFSAYGLIMLGVAMAWACSGTIIKALTRTEPPKLVVFYMVLVMTPLSLPGALWVWKPITLHQFWWLLVLGFVSNGFQLMLSTAISKTEMNVILPFDFSRLVFVSILGYIFFSEVPDFWTYVGSGVIVAASAYAAYREKLHKRRVRDAGPSA
jgi:drug/metabolite transporter (DMT)-like permease